MGARVATSPLDAAIAFEAAANRSVRDFVPADGTHRERLTAAILALAPRGGRLALLGAGNATDVDLARLGERFTEVHLVDIDRAALDRTIARQPPGLRSRLVAHGPVDLTGLLEHPGRVRSASGVALAGIMTGAGQRIEASLPGPFDAVASCCVLTQLAAGVARAVGLTLPLPGELTAALVTIHLRSLVALTAPAGGALLATDIASSDLHPLDALNDETDLAALASDLAVRNNVFASAHPLLLRRVLRRDPELLRTAGEAGPPAHWLWAGPQDRRYLVRALTLTRTRQPVTGQ